MLHFIQRFYTRRRLALTHLPDGVLRRVLAHGYGRAEPQRGGWLRLRQRAAQVRRAPVMLTEPVFYHHHAGALGRSGGLGARLALDASGMAWRLPWRSSLAACPLY